MGHEAKLAKQNYDRGKAKGYKEASEQAEKHLASVVAALLLKYDIPEVVVEETELTAESELQGKELSMSYDPKREATIYELVDAEEAED